MRRFALFGLVLLLFACGRNNPLPTAPPETPIPEETQSSSLKEDPNIFPLYSETYGGGVTIGVDAQLYIWPDGSSCSMSEEFVSDAPEGYKAQKCTAGSLGWLGWGIVPWNGSAQTTADMSDFASGHLHIYVKASDSSLSDLQIGISGGTDAWLTLANYGFAADGNWHHISIPISDFVAAGVDLTKISQYVMMRDESVTAGDTYYYDFIYWSKN